MFILFYFFLFSSIFLFFYRLLYSCPFFQPYLWYWCDYYVDFIFILFFFFRGRKRHAATQLVMPFLLVSSVVGCLSSRQLSMCHLSNTCISSTSSDRFKWLIHVVSGIFITVSLCIIIAFFFWFLVFSFFFFIVVIMMSIIIIVIWILMPPLRNFYVLG